MLRFLAIAATFLTSITSAFAAGNAIPSNYAGCEAGSAYTTKTPLLCTYDVPENKTEPDKIKDYLACQRSKPNHQYLQSYDCKYVTPEDMNSPDYVSCERDGMPTQFPGFDDDCRLFYYNPDYAYPKSLDECMQRDERKEDVTYELKRICRIVVSYAPQTKIEHYDKQEANRIIEKCQNAGGKAHVEDKRYPVCTLTFTQQ